MVEYGGRKTPAWANPVTSRPSYTFALRPNAATMSGSTTPSWASGMRLSTISAKPVSAVPYGV